jgi:hypothetical protein
MYQLRWVTYIACSFIGGAFFEKLIPGSTMINNAIWFMVGNVLYEVLEWKYNVEETNESEQ